MSLDLLSLVESAEHATVRVESAMRRHGLRLLLIAGAAAVLIAARRVPAPSTQAPSHDAGVNSVAHSLRPTAAPRAPRWSPTPARADARGARTTVKTPSEDTSAQPDDDTRRTSLTPATPRPSPRPTIYVHVAGAVARPGVVRLPCGARGFDAVRAAGGLLAEADLSRVNLAVRLRDEGMLTVPRLGVPSRRIGADDAETGRDVDEGASDAADASNESSAAIDGPPQDPPSTVEPRDAAEDDASADKATVETLTRRPVALNRADASALQRVPGIGPTLARAIISYRTRHGAFTEVSELRRVPRFGNRLYQRVRRCFVL